MFAYCGNNPVIFADITGYGKTYVFVYSTGNDFIDQAEDSPYFDTEDPDVIIIKVSTATDFVGAWNSMDEDIDNIYIYAHGGTGTLYFSESQISNDSDITFASLEEVDVSGITYLFSCHGGDGEEGNNVAWELAKLTNSSVRACTGSVSYSKIFGHYYARKAFDWGIWKYFYYSKKWILWGEEVARSSLY